MGSKHILSNYLLIGLTSAIMLSFTSVTLKGQTRSSNDIKLITVKGGAFEMGCTAEQGNCEDDEKPVHTVKLGDFQMSKYEITNQQYANFMNDIGAESNGSYNGANYMDTNDKDCQIKYVDGQFVPVDGKKNFPVVEVTWHGAKAFCEHYGGRLPTEAEWEFAARGGKNSTATRYAGSNNIADVAWYSGNSGGSAHQVGTKSPNELGIYDMTGNVWEWCSDWHDTEYYASSTQNNPQGSSSGTFRILRGGSWFFKAEHCRATNRAISLPDHSYNGNGFRFVKPL
ncbi:MAG: formylglycine-generating enzyme family protein [Salinivirgaceae bacterium]|jgi:sulfatase modifying factor 1|nr:formylglycine-generating enzyme family protein [Salinivirgaceae bacterium]